MARKLYVTAMLQTAAMWVCCGQITHDATGAYNITIGLLQNPLAPVSTNVLQQLSHNRNSSTGGLQVISMEQNTSSPTKLLQYVSRLSCDEAAVLIAPCPCDPAVTHVLRLSRIPTVVLYGHPLCFPNTDTHGDLVFHPPFSPVPDVISRLSIDRYDRVTVIYDESIGGRLPSLVSALEVALPSAVGINTLHVTPETVADVVTNAGLSGPKAYAQDTLHIVWASDIVTTKLLTEVNKNVSVLTALDSLAHWLVVCTNQTCLDHIGDILSVFTTSVNQLAVIHIDATSIHHSRTTPAFTTVLKRVEGSLKAASEAGYNLSTGSDSCQQISASVVETFILPALDQSTRRLECGPYEVYVPDVDREPPTLQSVSMCVDTATHLDAFPDKSKGLSGKYFVITTIESTPFVIKEEINGTVKFYGMAIDMLKELSRTLNFTYTISIVPDGQFGGTREDGNWTGMVGQLQRKEVNMSIASLSVTSSRSTVMDFVEYYFEYGAGIMKKPDEDENKWRVIVLPFRWPVWVCIVVSVPFAGLVAWMITQLVNRTVDRTPTGKDNFGHPGRSTWYTFGAVLTQGGHYLPESASGRTFICHWWVFCIIIVASYGGSLIAYLTISKTDAPFDDLDGLVRQSRYKWGFTEGSVYYSAFKNATGGVYKELFDGFQRIKKEDPNFGSVSKTTEQLARVQGGDYVYITDRTPLMVQVISDKACDLVLLSETFMPLPFGIGLQKGSPYKGIIYKGVKKLRQSGLIKFWEKKWWPKQSCSGIPIPEAHAVTLIDTQSAFYLLLAGVVAAAVVLFVELVRINVRALVRGICGTSVQHTKPVGYNGEKYASKQSKSNGSVVMNGHTVADMQW